MSGPSRPSHSRRLFRPSGEGIDLSEGPGKRRGCVSGCARPRNLLLSRDRLALVPSSGPAKSTPISRLSRSVRARILPADVPTLIRAGKSQAAARVGQRASNRGPPRLAFPRACEPEAIGHAPTPPGQPATRRHPADSRPRIGSPLRTDAACCHQLLRCGQRGPAFSR